MTNPPTDEELSNITHRAFAVEQTRAAENRALFTAGERRGIERCIEALRDPARPYMSAVHILESLRDAPAGEQKLVPFDGPDDALSLLGILRDTLACAEAHEEESRILGNVRAGDMAHALRYAIESLIASAEPEVEPPAKPEAAGEEPEVTRDMMGSLIRDLAAHGGLGGLSWQELSEQSRERYRAAFDRLTKEADRPAPAAKDAVEPIARLNLLVDGLRQTLEDAEEERDRLRARVAELEAERAAKG